MEVTVLRAEGAINDPDSILSIRAGTSRRQGSVQVDKKLYFPVNFHDSPLFKIDLIKQIGSGEACIAAENNEYAVPIVPRASSEKSPEMLLNLKVSGKPLLCGRRTEPPKSQVSDVTVSPADLADGLAGVEGDSQLGSAAQARRYFDDHNIMNLMKALLEEIIREQPENPHEHIAAFMDRLTGIKIPDGPKSAPLSPRDALIDGVARSTCPRWVKAFDAQDTNSTGTLDVDAFCEAITSLHPMVSAGQAMALAGGVALGGRSVSLAAFCAAAEAVAGGEPQAAELAGLPVEAYQLLGNQPTTSTDLRSKAKAALMASVVDEPVPRPPAPSRAATQMAGTHFGTDMEQEYEPSEVLARAKAILERDDEDGFVYSQAELRAKAKAALLASTLSFDEVPPAPVGTPVGDEQFVEDEDRAEYVSADLRAKAKLALTAAFASEAQAEQPKNLPLLAFNTIITAGLDGKLETIFAAISQRRGLPTLSVAPVAAEGSTTHVTSTSEAQAGTEKPEADAPLRGLPDKMPTSRTQASLVFADVSLPGAPDKQLTSRTQVLGDAKSTVPKVGIKSKGSTGSASAAQPDKEATPLSPRHSQLLERQRQLREQQCSMQDHLKRLRERQASATPTSLQPAAPRAPLGGPTGRRVVPGAAWNSAAPGETSASAFRDLREANATLGAENQRLNEELARLMSRTDDL